MSKAYILYGVSASGKSRYAKNLLEELRENNSIALYFNGDLLIKSEGSNQEFFDKINQHYYLDTDNLE